MNLRGRGRGCYRRSRLVLARLCRRCKVRRTHRLRLRGISDRLTRRRWFRFGFMFRPREAG